MMCFVVRGEISSDRIRQLFDERVITLTDTKGKLVYQRLQQSWTHFLGYAFWRNDTQFTLVTHIRDYDYEGDLSLPNPCNKEELQKVWPKLAEAPWKTDQSPWEVLIVPNYSKSGKTEPHTLIIFRVDHIHCDVYSLIGLFRILFQSPFKTPKPSRNNRVLSTWERLRVILTLPYEMAEVFQLLFKGRRIGGRTSERNMFCSISSNVSVEVIKSIKKMHDVEFATVINSAIQGAVDRALKNAGKESPSKLDLAYVLPLSNHPGGWHLHATMVVAELPCNADTSTERLYQTQSILKKFDQALVPISSVYFGRLFSLVPSRIIRAYFLFVMKFGPSFGMSNFPTTLSKEYVDGLEVVDVFTALTSSESLGMVISSWGVNGQQRFNFFLDKSIFGQEESAEKIAAFFEEELEALQKVQYPVIQK
ncbi:unnamed protein product [Allacma fusca]|uniref:O-acyltransferase WSD1 C-terminal domain-containing protein n=1 Tax=Allacma fusca TaxID=39272 RepID=A0A8J2JHZ1_9HEXA|nr:unnamed protein product [Allacma fusca]